jgi:site-specific DNA recombinase
LAINAPARATESRLIEAVSRVVVSDSLVQVQFGESESAEQPVPPLEIEYEHIESQGGTKIISVGEDRERTTGPDAALIKAVARANQWRRQLLDGEVGSLAEIAAKEHLQRTYVGRILPLAFLAPDITRAIVDGCQPPSMTIDRLRDPIPMDWNEQRVMFGFSAR